MHKIFLTIAKKSKLNPLHIVYPFIEKRTFQNAKKIIAISNMVKADIIKAYGIDESKIEVIYNGIKLQEYNYENSFKKLDNEFNIPKKNRIFLYVGSGFKRKGVEQFLEILTKLENKNFTAFIVGKESKMSYYQDLAKQMNLYEKVIFTGSRNDVSDFYSISDFFLFPTRYEPFGSVILEAMNFENVVLTTEFCGGGEVLDKKFIFKNSDEVARLINELSDEDIKKIKKQNLEIVKNYTIEKNTSLTLKAIEEFL